jgi:hypothetical protein
LHRKNDREGTTLLRSATALLTTNAAAGGNEEEEETGSQGMTCVKYIRITFRYDNRQLAYGDKF